VSVEGSVQWPTGDGLDVESGFNLTVRDSVFKTGDDCLAFRSGPYEATATSWPARIPPVQLVRISNLILTSSSSAIKFESSTVSNRTDIGDIFDVIIDNVRIEDSNRAIGIWQRSGTRSTSIRDIVIQNVQSVTRFDSKPQFWGSAEPLAVTVVPSGECCAGVRNITLINWTAISENGILISSFGSHSGTPSPDISGLNLVNVSLTIKKTGNTSRPQRDYRPVWDGGIVPETVPGLVSGLVVQNVQQLHISGGGVEFSPLRGPGKQSYWGMACINATGSEDVSVGGGWICHNVST
jgi:hypothetical protein